MGRVKVGELSKRNGQVTYKPCETPVIIDKKEPMVELCSSVQPIENVMLTSSNLTQSSNAKTWNYYDSTTVLADGKVEFDAVGTGIYSFRKPSYISDGLLCSFSGLNNTRNGHDATQLTKWEDLSDNHFDATFVGTPTINSSSILMRGGVYADLSSNSSLLNGPEILTVELIINPHAVHYTYDSFIARSKNYTHGYLRFFIENSNIRARFTQTTVFYLEYPLTLNTPISYVVTADKTKQTLYINGVQVNSVETTDFPKATGNNFFCIGSALDDRGGRRNTNADYYAVRCYNKCLSADEVASNYATDKRLYDL